jgi:putative ABC transport system permease protein
MTWLALSLKDWQRRPLRTSVSAAGVAIAIAALFSLLSFQRGYRGGMQKELDGLGAHVLVVPKGCPYDAASIALHGAKWPCYLSGAYLQQIRTTPGVATAAPVFMYALYDDAGAQTVYLGVDQNILALKPAWRITGRFPQASEELLIGAQLAKEHNWRLGDAIALPGLATNRATVSGILSPTGGSDDRFIFTQLRYAQRLFDHEGQLTHILVRLTDPEQLDAVVAQLRGCNAGLSMNIVPLAHLFHTIQNLVSSTRLFLGCLAAVALLIAGAGVTNTILMAVAERTREIGVMRSLGASRADIFGLFWLETLQLSLAGGIVGIGLALATSRTVEAWVRSRLPFSPTDALLQWQWPIAAACLASAIILGTAAGFLPAWRAASLSPIEAMRSHGKRT